MIRFFILFTVLLVGLFTLEILQPAEKYVILPFTSLIADVSVWIIQLFDDNVMSISNVIRDKTTGFGVRIGGAKWRRLRERVTRSALASAPARRPAIRIDR